MRVSDLHLPILMAKFPDRKATIKVLHTVQCVYPTSNLSILMAKFPDRKATIKVLNTLQCMYPTCTCPS